MTSTANISDQRRVLVYGASGHAKVVIDALEKQGRYQIIGLIDDDAELKGQDIYGYKVLGGKSDISAQQSRLCIVAIGDNRIRSEVANWLLSNEFSFPEAVIHPSAQLARGAAIGTGSVAMAGSVINSDTQVGSNSIVNTLASIDHDCRIGDSVHISPGAALCGGVSIGDFCLIGAGSTICPNVSIGQNVVVGAGSTVLDDVADNLTMAGTPARELSR